MESDFFGLDYDLPGRPRTAEEVKRLSQWLLRTQRISRVGGWAFKMASGEAWVSPEARRIYGIIGQEPLTISHLQTFPLPLHRPKLDAALRDLLERQQPYDVEFQITRRTDGAVVYLHSLAEFDAAQGVVLGVIEDITERKQTETRLRASEERYKALFDRSLDCVYLIDFAGDFLDANQAALALLGIRREDLIGQNLGSLLTADQLPLAHEQIQEVITTGRQQHVSEFRLRHRDGREVLVETLASLIYHEGKPYAIQGIAHDITGRKRAEAEQARLATAVEQAAESIVITDPHGAILYVNPAFEKITGYTRAEAVGQNSRLLSSGRHDTAFYRQMWAMLKRGEVWTGHFINRRKDATLYEEEATISPVRDAAGQIVNFVAVKRDVTREVQLEENLRQMQKMDAIGQLAGGVAHDFNNILLALLMQAELLEEREPMSAAVREGLQQIREDANRAAELTRQLLLFSRRQVLQPRRLDVNEVVTRLARMLQRIIGEDVQLQLRLHTTPLFIHADPGMMEQVLMNLAVNARDAMPGGGLLLIETAHLALDAPAARLIPEAGPGHYACFRVSDTGEGIPPEVLPRIFEPFFTTKEIGKGTGLGLATVFGIVKQHQGWIKVDTGLGKGTTFRIFLPVCPAETMETVPAAARPASPNGTETILLVEDESPVRGVLCEVLERHGYRVLAAADGGEALKLWSEQGAAVALLLTDLVMPGAMGGQELARRLLAEQPRLKVIYTSGYSVETAGRELHLRPGERFIQKPYNPEALLQTIRESLDG
jgi:PAS domain S-box-containing protein